MKGPPAADHESRVLRSPAVLLLRVASRGCRLGPAVSRELSPRFDLFPLVLAWSARPAAHHSYSQLQLLAAERHAVHCCQPQLCSAASLPQTQGQELQMLTAALARHCPQCWISKQSGRSVMACTSPKTVPESEMRTFACPSKWLDSSCWPDRPAHLWEQQTARCWRCCCWPAVLLLMCLGMEALPSGATAEPAATAQVPCTAGGPLRSARVPRLCLPAFSAACQAQVCRQVRLPLLPRAGCPGRWLPVDCSCPC